MGLAAETGKDAMARAMKLTIISLGALALGSCASLPMGSLGGESVNFASGSALSYRLAGADREALEAAFLRAMDEGAVEHWRGRRASGAVTPEGYALANLLEHPAARIALARPEIDLHQIVETELGLYALTRNANVRLGPGTHYPIAEEMRSGDGVDVVGRVTDKPWMLVAVAGAVRGYIHANLMRKAPGTELELAGGPHRRPVLCRGFSQTMTVRGASDAWSGAACKMQTGWRIAAPDPAPVEEEDDLLGY